MRCPHCGFEMAQPVPKCTRCGSKMALPKAPWETDPRAKAHRARPSQPVAGPKRSASPKRAPPAQRTSVDPPPSWADATDPTSEGRSPLEATRELEPDRADSSPWSKKEGGALAETAQPVLRARPKPKLKAPAVRPPHMPDERTATEQMPIESLLENQRARPQPGAQPWDEVIAHADSKVLQKLGTTREAEAQTAVGLKAATTGREATVLKPQTPSRPIQAAPAPHAAPTARAPNDRSDTLPRAQPAQAPQTRRAPPSVRMPTDATIQEPMSVRDPHLSVPTSKKARVNSDTLPPFEIPSQPPQQKAKPRHESFDIDTELPIGARVAGTTPLVTPDQTTKRGAAARATFDVTAKGVVSEQVAANRRAQGSSDSGRIKNEPVKLHGHPAHTGGDTMLGSLATEDWSDADVAGDSTRVAEKDELAGKRDPAVYVPPRDPTEIPATRASPPAKRSSPPAQRAAPKAPRTSAPPAQDTVPMASGSEVLPQPWEVSDVDVPPVQVPKRANHDVNREIAEFAGQGGLAHEATRAVQLDELGLDAGAPLASSDFDDSLIIPGPKASQDVALTPDEETKEAADIQVTAPSLVRRAGASTVDLVLIVAVVVGVSLTGLFGPEVKDPAVLTLDGFARIADAGHLVLPAILLVLLALIGSIVTHGVFGRSLGKLIFGLRVVRKKTAEPPSIVRATVRALLSIVGAALGGLGYYWAVVDAQARPLHDILSGTTTIRGRPTTVER